MKIKIHLSTWFLKPFKAEGYLINEISHSNLVWAKSYSILFFTIYRYDG